MLLSDCGGHAGYHNHEALACEYSAAAAGHSALVGVLLDGRGLYGQFENTGVLAANLDACNGHYGPTPATTVVTSTGATAYPASASVYHYHITTEAPFVAGCFGPAPSLAAASALYASCTKSSACVCDQSKTCSCSAGQVMSSVCTSLGSYASYTLDCPVYRDMATGASQSQLNTADPACVPCAGNCAGTAAGTSGSASAAASSPAQLSSTDSAIIGGVVGGGGGLLALTLLYRFFFRPAVPSPLTSIPIKSAAIAV
jgi:hypothetical protein